ncbi:MAG: ribonuclease E/G, partial [Gordonia sp. (in: high G+C Gram-positive bacteria)]
MTSKQVLAHLHEMGVTARTAQSSISRADAEAVELRITGGDAAGAETTGPGTAGPEAAGAEAAPASESASAPSLFSAVETPQPVTASRADASAPLFISAEPEAAAKAAKPA